MKLKLSNLRELQDSIGGTVVASCEGYCSLRGSCTREGQPSWSSSLVVDHWSCGSQVAEEHIRDWEE